MMSPAGAHAVETLLAKRARALATPRVAHDAAVAADMMEVLIFLIGGEQLAMSLASIVAVIRAPVVSPLPHTVAPVYGVTAWRGRPLTVLSLGATTSAQNMERRVVVLGDGLRAAVGLLADSVDTTRAIARSALSAAHAGARREFALGVTSDGVLVLDADTLVHATRSEL